MESTIPAKKVRCIIIDFSIEKYNIVHLYYVYNTLAICPINASQ